MGIRDLKNRTRTYLAGDWDGDKDAIDQLHKWNESDFWSLHFIDVHDLTSSSDDSLNCSIKKSLKSRMDISKTFVIVIGENTKQLRSGACYLCKNYDSNYSRCKSGYCIDNDSYVENECKRAKETGVKIVVLYNSACVNKRLCIESIKDTGTHVAMKKADGSWDYQTIKNAIMN